MMQGEKKVTLRDESGTVVNWTQRENLSFVVSVANVGVEIGFILKQHEMNSRILEDTQKQDLIAIGQFSNFDQTP